MLDNLVRANVEANRDRESRDVPKVVELDVDCTDPYGRYEIDADSHGGSAVTTEAATTITTSSKEVGVTTEDATAVAAGGTSPTTKSTPKVTMKRVTVFVETSPTVQLQQTVVLSAAVSSTKRIRKDCHVAFTIAKRFDITRGVPDETKCEFILTKLFPSIMQDGKIHIDGDEGEEQKKSTNQTIEDALDVTIAYLRRVHLFTFYNGCAFANNVGAVVGGTHAASPIHVRLKGADEILKKTREENADIYDDLPMGGDDNNDGGGVNNNNNHSNTMNKEEQNEMLKTEEEESMNVDNNGNDVNDDITTKAESAAQSTDTKDMLVMRLDDSIAEVLQKMNKSMEISSPFIVNQSTDAIASEIESLEEKTKKDWINNHAVIDNDGRARCSFHFCNKLFRDRNFLQKHLLKKHPEFLKAEVAKCHDAYMMEWWDNEDDRPVPPICIDCGSKFGFRLSPVLGAAEPMTKDPEPELWEEEQKHVHQLKEEEDRCREKRVAVESMDQRHRHSYGHSNNNDQSDNVSGNGGGAGIDSMNAVSNFVDVDDMKDEKVQLSFENVEVVTVTPINNKSGKKKKKKKKLL